MQGFAYTVHIHMSKFQSTIRHYRRHIDRINRAPGLEMRSIIIIMHTRNKHRLPKRVLGAQYVDGPLGDFLVTSLSMNALNGPVDNGRCVQIRLVHDQHAIMTGTMIVRGPKLYVDRLNFNSIDCDGL